MFEHDDISVSNGFEARAKRREQLVRDRAAIDDELAALDKEDKDEARREINRIAARAGLSVRTDVKKPRGRPPKNPETSR